MRKETRTKTITEEYYITSDGKEFSDSFWAQRHEEDLEMEQALKSADKFRIRRADCLQWPSAYGADGNCECQWFRITSDEELAEFCNANRFRFRREKMEADLKNGSYPMYVCVAEFPNNADESEYFVLSDMLAGYRRFLAEFLPLLPDEDMAKIGKELMF